MKHRDEDGRTLLHTAAAAGERASTREATRAAYGDTERHVFFERGVFVVYAILTPPPARRPLVNLRAGKVQLCDFFLRTPGGQLLVDKGDEEDWVPLHSAASCGHVEVAASLLAAGWGRCKLHPGLKAAPSGGISPKVQT